jgi:hypothetical protein
LGDESPLGDSKFCTFPSLSRGLDGTLRCTALVGTQKTGPDGRTVLVKSTDGGRTWQPGPSPTIWDEQADPRFGYMMCHIAELARGHLLAAYLRVDRFNPSEPLFHPKTNGMQRSVVRLCESRDDGQTWSKPWDLDYRLPDVMAPGAILRLPDGALGIPFEVWHEWDKGFREGPSTRLAISSDGGKTWPYAGMIARDTSNRTIHGDPRLTVLPDGRLVVLLWVYSIDKEQDLPVHRSESRDGRTWSAPQSTGLIGQIANPAALRDHLLLCVYQKRFGADAGLRAVLSPDDGVTWDARTDTLLWSTGQHSAPNNPFSGYEQYSFGYSTVLRESEHQVLVPFWASNGKTTCIRILKVEVDR